MKRLNLVNKSMLPILVEGKKDTRCLKDLGLENRIISLQRRPLYEVVESIVQLNIKEIILLTDLDKEGKKLFGTLNSNLTRHGVKVNTKFRNYLWRYTKLRQIEGLKHYLDKLDTSAKDA